MLLMRVMFQPQQDDLIGTVNFKLNMFVCSSIKYKPNVYPSKGALSM